MIGSQAFRWESHLIAPSRLGTREWAPYLAARRITTPMHQYEGRTWRDAAIALAAIAAWLERDAIPSGLVDDVGSWEAFLRRAWPVLGTARSAQSLEEIEVAAGVVGRLLDQQRVGPTVRAWLEALSPASAVYFATVPASSARTVQALLPQQEAAVHAIMRALRAGESRGDAGGGKAPPLAPRFANAALVEGSSRRLLRRDGPLAQGQVFRLRLDIGELSVDSTIENPVPIPDRLLPSEDLPLDVVVSSAKFRVGATLSQLGEADYATGRLILPRDGGPARSPEGNKYLYFFLRAPNGKSVARARIGYYYRNHLVQSQILQADIGEGDGEYRIEVDYTLSQSLVGIENLPARPQLSVLTGDSADGMHRIVLRSSDTDGEILGGPCTYEIDEYAVGHLISTLRDVLRGTGVAPTQKVRRKDQLVRDLRQLAPLGWQLWNAVVGPRFHEVYDVLDKFDGVVLQVSRPSTSSYAFPWGLIYDIPLISGEEVQVCPLVDSWDGAAVLVSQGMRRCPEAPKGHAENTLCPFGFWGYRYPIEQLSSTDGPVTEIPVSRDGVFDVVAIETEKGVSEAQLAEHIGVLQRLLVNEYPGARLREAKNRADARQLLKSDTPLVYFYCHGERPGISTPGVPSAIRREQTYLGIDGNETLTPTDIAGWVLQWRREEGRKVWDRVRPLVFINACHSAEINPDTLVSYLDAFVGTANAAGVIGTEVRVDQNLAMDVAVQFFRCLFKGWTVDESLHAVRLDYLASGNLLGLVYTPYCMADLSLVAVP